MSWLTPHKLGWILHLKVSPGAKQTALVEMQEPWLRVRIHAAPQKGQANEELLDWLCTVLKVRSNQVTLIRGHSSSFKAVLISECSASHIQESLHFASPKSEPKQEKKI